MAAVVDTPKAEWITRPFELPSGGQRMGFFVIGGDKPAYYRAITADNGWDVAKENADGTFAEPYRVIVTGPPWCGCRGFGFGGDCRHLKALRTLLNQLGF